MVERKQPQKLPTYAQPTKCSDLKITGKQLTQQQPPKFISKPVIQKRVTIPQFQPKITSKVSIKPKRECLVYWVRHGARADQDYSSPLAGTYVYENDIDTYLTEQGHKDAVLAGERIIADVKLQGWNPEEVLKEVKVISSPLLRTLQTSAGIKNQSIIVNEYMINELRDWDADYLTKSCYATMPHLHILNKYLKFICNLNHLQNSLFSFNIFTTKLNPLLKTPSWEIYHRQLTLILIQATILDSSQDGKQYYSSISSIVSNTSKNRFQQQHEKHIYHNIILNGRKTYSLFL